MLPPPSRRNTTAAPSSEATPLPLGCTAATAGTHGAPARPSTAPAAWVASTRLSASTAIRGTAATAAPAPADRLATPGRARLLPHHPPLPSSSLSSPPFAAASQG